MRQSIIAPRPASLATGREIRVARLYPRSPYATTSQGLELRLQRQTSVLLSPPSNCGPGYLVNGRPCADISSLKPKATGIVNRVWVDQVEVSSMFRSRQCLLEIEEVVYVHTSTSAYKPYKLAIVDETLAVSVNARPESTSRKLRLVSPMSVEDFALSPPMLPGYCPGDLCQSRSGFGGLGRNGAGRP